MRKHYVTLSRDLPEESLINLTPLIDVVFVVLIMFILVAPLIKLDRISLAAAQADKQAIPIKENTLIKIHVFSDNTIWVNNTPIQRNNLYPLMQACKKQMPTTIPQVYHDKEASFGTYQIVKNALEAAGFEEMDVILKSGEYP